MPRPVLPEVGRREGENSTGNLRDLGGAKVPSSPRGRRGMSLGKSEGGRWAELKLPGVLVRRSLQSQVEGHVGGTRKQFLANGKSRDILDSCGDRKIPLCWPERITVGGGNPWGGNHMAGLELPNSAGKREEEGGRGRREAYLVGGTLW